MASARAVHLRLVIEAPFLAYIFGPRLSSTTVGRHSAGSRRPAVLEGSTLRVLRHHLARRARNPRSSVPAALVRSRCNLHGRLPSRACCVERTPKLACSLLHVNRRPSSSSPPFERLREMRTRADRGARPGALATSTSSRVRRPRRLPQVLSAARSAARHVARHGTLPAPHPARSSCRASLIFSQGGGIARGCRQARSSSASFAARRARLHLGRAQPPRHSSRLRGSALALVTAPLRFRPRPGALYCLVYARSSSAAASRFLGDYVAVHTRPAPQTRK